MESNSNGKGFVTAGTAKIWCVVPVGTRDRYAAGYEVNNFATREEAEATILGLRALGIEWNHEWEVIEVSDAG